MSSNQRSGRKRASILQGVYEENVRTRRDEPSPRPDGTAGEGEDASPTLRRRGVVFALVAGLLVVAVAAGLYAAGAVPATWQRLLPVAQASPGRAALAVADSVQGRDAPFAAAASSEEARSLATQTGEAGSVANLFGLEVQTVVIDPGHGGKKDGAVGPGGTKEKHVALDVSHRLRRRLEAHYGYRILMTRTGDRHLSLRERAEYANTHQADLFISVHVNALPDSSVRSVETYYYGRQTSADVRRLAQRENQNSGYSVAAFDRLLEETGQRMRRQESKRLAGSIQKSLFRNISRQAPDVRDWGVHTAPFVVLLGVEAPSVLAEIGVISSPGGEKKLRRPAYRAELAAFLEEGIARYLGATPAEAASPDSATAPAGPPAAR